MEIINQVSNSDRAIFSVHCHDGLGLAVANSLTAIKAGARQIECSLNGLGARKGNADLAQITTKIRDYADYILEFKTNLLAKASRLVTNF